MHRALAALAVRDRGVFAVPAISSYERERSEPLALLCDLGALDPSSVFKKGNR